LTITSPLAAAELFPLRWRGLAAPPSASATPASTTTKRPARVGYVWGQIMVRLKEYAETGNPKPVFA
jgi:hypothetical protein